MSLGVIEVFLIALVLVLVPVVGIVSAVSAGSLPDWAFERAGTSKTLWVALPLVGFVTCGLVSIVAAVVWFASYKPRVTAAAQQGGPAQSPV